MTNHLMCSVRVIVSTVGVRTHACTVLPVRPHACRCRICVCVCARVYLTLTSVRCMRRTCRGHWDTEPSPAGEGDEAQLGIIKLSTVSVKGTDSQVGLVSPPHPTVRAAWAGTRHYPTVSPHCVPGSEESEAPI